MIFLEEIVMSSMLLRRYYNLEVGMSMGKEVPLKSKDFLKGKDLYQVERKMDGLESIKLQKKASKVIFTCAP